MMDIVGFGLCAIALAGVGYLAYKNLPKIKEWLAKHPAPVPSALRSSVSNVVVPPVVTAPKTSGALALPAGIDTPDARGFVKLTGVTNSRGNARVSIAEVGAALGGVQHASVALNSGFLANGRWITGQFIGVCAEIEAVTDGTTGAQTYRLKDPQVPIPGTLALPPHFTVASATAYLNSLGEPVVGSGAGFH